MSNIETPDPPPVDLPPASAAHPEVAQLLAQLDEATAEWREELEELVDLTIPQIVWQPFPGGHSIGALLLHITDVEAYWLHEIATGFERSPEEQRTLLSEETDQYAIQWPVPPAQPLAWYWAQLDAIRARTKTLLHDAAPNATGKRASDGRVFTLRWLFSHVITHEAYHGGQAVLLGLMQAESTRK